MVHMKMGANQVSNVFGLEYVFSGFDGQCLIWTLPAN